MTFMASGKQPAAGFCRGLRPLTVNRALPVALPNSPECQEFRHLSRMKASARLPAMALKPPPINDVFKQVNDLLGDSGLKAEVDKNVKSLAQSALGRLDLVSREEFDAQTEVLARTRARVEELEKELEALMARLESEDD